MNFANYDLTVLAETPGGVYDLADGVLREVAQAFGHRIGIEPTEEDIRAFIAAVAPSKNLQENIEHAVQMLGRGNKAMAVQIAADWLERSCLMEAVQPRPFCRPAAQAFPGRFDFVLWQGAVANWIFRREAVTLRLPRRQVGRVVLAIGNGGMKADEHELVEAWKVNTGQLPTQSQFVGRFVLPRLERAWFDEVDMLSVDSTAGRDIVRALVTGYPDILDGTALVVGNAPETLTGAGQIRNYLRERRSAYDKGGTQLYMVGDSFPIATRGQDKSTHQNSLSGIGVLLRAALNLDRAAKEFAAA